MVSSYFTYNREKVLQALRYHFINRREIKFMIILVNVFAIFSAILYFTHKVNPVAFLLSSGLWFTLMISFWFLLPYIIYKRSATFKEKFRVDFDSDEMAIEKGEMRKGWKWTAFSSFLETPYFFYLYFDAKTFFLIPKDSFSDIQKARHILQEKIGGK